MLIFILSISNLIHERIYHFYMKPEELNTDSNVTQTIQMIEMHWRMQPNGEVATRGIFMTALQNITQIFVRGTASVAFTSLTLVSSAFCIH